MALVGRVKECAQIDELLDAVREGLGGVLVVRGDAGVGKTALLDHAVDQAHGLNVVHLTGVETERDLSFAALHRLLGPMLDRVGRLPSPQREALTSALGLAAGPPANPFLVGLAVISLTAEMSDADRGLLCIVDDVQWMDSESLAALTFWGRRLRADRVALIFGERTGVLSGDHMEALPLLEVGGLDRDTARDLLIYEAGFEPDRDVLERVLAETEGNPLAIRELAKNLASDLLVGRAASPHPLPLTRRLEDRFAAQVQALPADTQMFLLLVAADASADPTMVWNAATRLGVEREAAEAAEAADLISLGFPVRYRHPLIRSAVYGAAAPADRRAAHGALAAVTDPAEVERRAWHLAGAVVGPDEEVAALLESCAERAISNGAISAAVALLSRAAELSADKNRAAQRQMTAAEAAVERGSLHQTHVLVERASRVLRSSTGKARAERVCGLADLREGNLVASASRLRLAATGLFPQDPQLGRRTLLEAMDIAVYRGDAAASEFMRLVAATDAHIDGTPSSVVELLLSAFSTHARAGYTAAAPEYHKAIAFCRDAPAQDLAPWTNLIVAVTRNVWDDASHDLLLRRIVDWSRSHGSLFPLWLALFYLGTGAAARGEFALRSALFGQAADVLSITGPFSVPRIGIPLDALRRQDPEVFAQMSETLGEMDPANAYAAQNVLLGVEIGRAGYSEALSYANALFDADPVMLGPQTLPDMVEAAVRVGDRDVADKALARLTTRATAAGTPWALGLLARSEALVAGADAEAKYQTALELFGLTTMEFHHARTHLLYGEWLRRGRRHVDARTQLRQAHEMFVAIGAAGYAERARVELYATGGRVRSRTADTHHDLTAQEAQVSQLVGQGANNREIAAQLFISPSTVEYHLHKVFRKLGVKSRTQLARRMLEIGAN